MVENLLNYGEAMPNPKLLNLSPPGPRAEAAKVAAENVMKRHSSAVKLGERIRYYRVLRKLTQEELAARAGCTVVTLSRWENGVGTVNILLRNLLMLARELNVKLSMLLRGIDLR